jgi:O-acetyl-ADP-ribose deacetylase (regulator of RNase III)
VQSCITRQHVQVIVNAANSGTCSGGDVDGSIHRADELTILANGIARFLTGCHGHLGVDDRRATRPPGTWCPGSAR